MLRLILDYKDTKVSNRNQNYFLRLLLF